MKNIVSLPLGGQEVLLGIINFNVVCESVDEVSEFSFTSSWHKLVHVSGRDSKLIHFLPLFLYSLPAVLHSSYNLTVGRNRKILLCQIIPTAVINYFGIKFVPKKVLNHSCFMSHFGFGDTSSYIKI